MADEAPASEIQINVKGPNELKLQISITTDKTVAELKQAIAEKSDVEADRQRLIYSGRVLKDDDVLSVYKIQSSHTIHMVKGVSRSGASSSAQPAQPQQLPTMQTGQNPHDPLTQLNSHLGFGAMAGINPFADMGLNPNDPNMMQGMLDNPQFVQQMSTMLSNPAILDQVAAMNPAMAPQMRAMMQSPYFREMVANPDRLSQMLRMASMFRESGAGGAAANPFAGAGAGGFPAPGVPGGAGAAPGATAASLGSPGAGIDPANPFASLLGGAGAGAGGLGGGLDPAMMQQLLGGMGGGGMGGMGGLGGAGAFGGGSPFGGASPAPTDTRPPEERFQVQLQQLQDMGFTNASQNIRALLATGGNVHSAIEYILGGGGL
ncbi:hypothetical protein BD626DRAFT_525421 [Schizophyllum amplum]|uniref:Uncharacterized protein n=1 Tax=Schizophyllum amplum TaxID=97359 RepID=A0A550BSI5_9AGAR|nr:hypothetical protein BD626DRAFT_525421 [Auriculariopsis ampla]